jgi:hypothetical protein
LAAVIAALMLAAAWWPVAALADGDPASDVLASQPLFLPSDAGIPAAQQAQLSALLDAAQRSGYPIRVALIASKTDLGSVTGLWRSPRNYAKFLGQELSLVNQRPLLVVMPNGFGLSGPAQTVAGGESALHGVPISGGGGGLASAAMTAVQRLAAAAGHRLVTPQASAPASSSSSRSVIPWIVLAGGAAMILAAWTASLRARPLRRRA